MPETSGSRSRSNIRSAGTRTGVFLPSEIVHSAGRPALLGESKSGAKQAGHVLQRLLGFWFVYHALGGVEAMIESGLWPKSTAYKQLAEFREFYGCEPDELELELLAAIRSAAAGWPEKYAAGFDAVISAQRQAGDQ